MVVAAEVVGWWALTWCVWALTLSALSLSDALLAVGCGLPCAVAAAGARKALGARWSPDPRWLSAAVVVPVTVVAEAVKVLVLPFRRRQPRGEFRTLNLSGAGSPARAATRRAVGVFTVSSTPGTFVVDTDPDHGTALAHFLVSGGPAVERTMTP